MGRIEVDPELSPVEIRGSILNEVFAHALESLPEECCGLISGSAASEFESAHRCRNDMTRHHKRDPLSFPRDGRRAFFMNELDYLQVQEEVDRSGGRVAALYHSHVGAAAYFSDLDQQYAESELFPFPDALHIVVAMVNRRVACTACFERRDGSFRGRALRALTP